MVGILDLNSAISIKKDFRGVKKDFSSKGRNFGGEKMSQNCEKIIRDLKASHKRLFLRNIQNFTSGIYQLL